MLCYILVVLYAMLYTHNVVCNVRNTQFFNAMLYTFNSIHILVLYFVQCLLNNVMENPM